jgi:hypothetical protein
MLTSPPIAVATPDASKPSTRGSPPGSLPARIFTSAGFTETALTWTKRSRGPGWGTGSSMSSRLAGSELGKGLR